MTDKKHDLTRIEDLGEFLHELQEESNSSESETAFGLDDLTGSTSTSLPDGESPFQSFDEAPAFAATENPVEETQEDTIFDFPAEETSFFETNTDFPETIEERPLSSQEKATEPEPFFVQEAQSYKSPETFEDVKKFAESTSFTGMAVEGNPSFSVLIKNVRYIEDVNDIITLMNELKLLNDPEDQVRSRLSRGTFLVPRISEFAAIYLAHKLRRFDIDIQIGLSDEIHPPKHGEKPEVGLVSKSSLYQNQAHHFHFDDPKLELSQIMVSATASLEGHQIIRYLGVGSEHKMLDGRIVEDEGSTEIPQHYHELAMRLKAHALKASANAVVGLNYQLTPIPSEYGTSSHKYRLSCTGNLVWVNKL